MIVRTRCIDVPGNLSAPIERSLRLRLARHAGLLESVHITLVRPAKAADSRCRVHLRLRDGSRASIEELDPDLGEAAGRVAWRLDRRLGRRAGIATSQTHPTRSLPSRSP